MQYIKYYNKVKKRGINVYASLKTIFGLSIHIEDIPGVKVYLPEPNVAAHPIRAYNLILLWFKIEYYYEDKNGHYNDELPPNDTNTTNLKST